MTHLYVIAVGGRIQPRPPDAEGAAQTAIAWAADHVIAVGADDVVRSISRGDSTFLDLDGCAVTALPDDLDAALAVLGRALEGGENDADLGAILMDAGALPAEAVLELGSPADLAFWSESGSGPLGTEAPRVRLVAVVRRGRFTEGDPSRGPFSRAAPR